MPLFLQAYPFLFRATQLINRYNAAKNFSFDFFTLDIQPLYEFKICE